MIPERSDASPRTRPYQTLLVLLPGAPSGFDQRAIVAKVAIEAQRENHFVFAVHRCGEGEQAALRTLIGQAEQVLVYSAWEDRYAIFAGSHLRQLLRLRGE
jgi:hypothetical protein